MEGDIATSSSNLPNIISNNRSIDPSNRLFLNCGENAALLLVDQPLSRDNYNTWSRSMLVSLSAKNTHVYIDNEQF